MTKIRIPKLASMQSRSRAWQDAQAILSVLEPKAQEITLRLDILGHEDFIEYHQRRQSDPEGVERTIEVRDELLAELETVLETVRAAQVHPVTSADPGSKPLVSPETEAGLALARGLPVEIPINRAEQRKRLVQEQEIIATATHVQHKIIEDIQSQWRLDVAKGMKAEYAHLIERHYRAAEAMLNALVDLREVQAEWFAAGWGMWDYGTLPHPLLNGTFLGNENIVREDVGRIRTTFEAKGFI